METKSGNTMEYIISQNHLLFYADFEEVLRSLEDKEFRYEERVTELTAELEEQTSYLARIRRDKHRLIHDYALDCREYENG